MKSTTWFLDGANENHYCISKNFHCRIKLEKKKFNILKYLSLKYKKYNHRKKIANKHARQNIAGRRLCGCLRFWGQITTHRFHLFHRVTFRLFHTHHFHFDTSIALVAFISFDTTTDWPSFNCGESSAHFKFILVKDTIAMSTAVVCAHWRCANAVEWRFKLSRWTLARYRQAAPIATLNINNDEYLKEKEIQFKTIQKQFKNNSKQIKTN